jgi:hypothetical protein
MNKNYGSVTILYLLCFFLPQKSYFPFNSWHVIINVQLTGAHTLQQDTHCMSKHNTQAHSPDHSWCGKAISIEYSGCVSIASVIQQAQCMRHIILSSVAYLTVQYFPPLSYKRQDFRKNVFECKIVF